jgi:hypothetical protein
MVIFERLLRACVETALNGKGSDGGVNVSVGNGAN